MSQIKCENVSLGYEGRTICEHLDFEINKGDYVCIVGENGSGKSTLMKALLSLKSPLSGNIIFGEQLSRRDIGYLPQQSTTQRDFPATVKEVVLSGCLSDCGLRPFYSAREKERATVNMERLGIKDLSSRCYRELSGGQQQRVLLARALCATGQMLLLDEPVAGLDPKVSAEMYDLIEDLSKNCKITVVMISHDISAALKYSTHILHLGEKPLFFGKTSDYIVSDVASRFIGEKKEED